MSAKIRFQRFYVSLPSLIALTLLSLTVGSLLSRTFRTTPLISGLDIATVARIPGVSRPHNNSLTSLIIVVGHSNLVTKQITKDTIYNVESWYSDDMPKAKERMEAYVSHIETGMRECRKKKDSLLVLSGGVTRKSAGPLSEALSYWLVADVMGWMNGLKDRVYLEEMSRDSLENLLFSLCRFREVTGHYPEKITIVGLNIKRPRFIDLHRRAIRWPSDKFEYIGIGDKGEVSVEPEVPNNELGISAGEYQHSYLPFSKDLYGCHGSLLKKKKRRDPFSLWHRPLGVALSCPEMFDLLTFCSKGDEIFDGVLPW